VGAMTDTRRVGGKYEHMGAQPSPRQAQAMGATADRQNRLRRRAKSAGLVVRKDRGADRYELEIGGVVVCRRTLAEAVRGRRMVRAGPQAGPQTSSVAAAVSRYGRGLALEELVQALEEPTNDCVMAQWFGEFWLPKMKPSPALPRLKRPSWLRATDTYAWAERWRRYA
jgi:hypothetical protein